MVNVLKVSNTNLLLLFSAVHNFIKYVSENASVRNFRMWSLS